MSDGAARGTEWAAGGGAASGGAAGAGAAGAGAAGAGAAGAPRPVSAVEADAMLRYLGDDEMSMTDVEAALDDYARMRSRDALDASFEARAAEAGALAPLYDSVASVITICLKTEDLAVEVLRRLDGIDQRLDGIGRRLDGIDQRLAPPGLPG